MELKSIDKAENLIKEIKELKSVISAFEKNETEYPPYVNFITERIGLYVWKEVRINKKHNYLFIEVVKQIISELESELEKL